MDNFKDVRAAMTWRAKLFGCTEDTESCLFSWFLPCVQYGRNVESLGEGIVGDRCQENCCAYTALMLCGLSVIASCTQRVSVRNKYKIEGSSLVDFGLSYCCWCFVLSQNHREMFHPDRLMEGNAV
ncbi:hypothetical protein Pelo_4017 [Pelomyxa schiedti]|nr:hypothetical protein Pelo_4017 [Pelomyxa schiedti]